ncbi:MAG: hypothetical protein JXK05_04460 [Campylobacterales bacterium]|nr:hypothetical protein [Campylobacterales bacterium]
MKLLILAALLSLLLGACASKKTAQPFDEKSYQRQNEAAQKSLDTLKCHAPFGSKI